MTNHEEVEKLAEEFAELVRLKLQDEALSILDDLGDRDPKSFTVVLAYLMTAAKNGFKAGARAKGGRDTSV